MPKARINIAIVIGDSVEGSYVKVSSKLSAKKALTVRIIFPPISTEIRILSA